MRNKATIRHYPLEQHFAPSLSAEVEEEPNSSLSLAGLLAEEVCDRLGMFPGTFYRRNRGAGLR